MPLQSTGSAVSESIVFNSGVVTINGKKLDTLVGNIQINNSFDIKKLRTLNSIKARKIRRSTLEAGVSFELSGGFVRELYALFNSSSSSDTGGQLYTVSDGQQTAATVYITCYEDDDSTTPKAYQYQLVNPVISNNNNVLATEEFATVTVEIACTEIKEFVSSGVAN